MAEAAALVGLIASIASLIELSAKVLSRLYDLTSKTSDIPELFRSLSVWLPLLTITIQHIRNQAEAGHLADDVTTALKAVVDSTSTQISALQTRLSKILPPDNAPKLERVLKALKSLVKEDRVCQALEKIHKNIEVLVLHQTTRHIDISHHISEELLKLHVASATSSKSFDVTLKNLSQRSDEMMRWTVDFRTDLFQIIADLRQEQTRVRLTILHSAQRDLPLIRPGTRTDSLVKAAHQSGSGLKHFGDDSSRFKIDNLSESDRAFDEMALRDQTLRIFNALFSLIKFRCIPSLAQGIKALIAYIWLLYLYPLQIFALLRSTIPRVPLLLVADSIIFEDVLGRTSKLQYEYFRHWNVFEAFLRCTFKGLPGEGKIISGDYYLLDSNIQGLIINKAHWERIVFPGRKVSMSVVIKALYGNERTCPRPGCVGKSARAPNQQSTSCSICGLRCFLLREFSPPKSTNIVKAMPEENPQKGWSDCVEPARENTELNGSEYSGRAILKDSESLELLQFRCVHVNSTLLALETPFTSPKSYGILQAELYNPDLEGHRSANPKVDREDGQIYIYDTIDWIIRKGDKVSAQDEIHLEAVYDFPLRKKKWFCKATIFVSDTWQQSHYPFMHARNYDAREVASIEFDLTNLRTQGIFMVQRGHESIGYYTVSCTLVIIIKGGSLKLEVRALQKSVVGETIKRSVASVCIERAF